MAVQSTLRAGDRVSNGGPSVGMVRAFDGDRVSSGGPSVGMDRMSNGRRRMIG